MQIPVGYPTACHHVSDSGAQGTKTTVAEVIERYCKLVAFYKGNSIPIMERRLEMYEGSCRIRVRFGGTNISAGFDSIICEVYAGDMVPTANPR